MIDDTMQDEIDKWKSKFRILEGWDIQYSDDGEYSGQCNFGVDKAEIFQWGLGNVPDDYITVTSSLGEKKPKNILVIPFIYNETVTGVLEIGSFNEFSGLETTFLEGISERVAIAINSSQARVQIQSALMSQGHTMQDIMKYFK